MLYSDVEGEKMHRTKRNVNPVTYTRSKPAPAQEDNDNDDNDDNGEG